MAHAGNILLGRITKLHGYEGAVTVKLEQDFSGLIPDTGPVFLEYEGKPVPFFISYLDLSRPGIAIMAFDGYSSVERMREFAGCRVFMRSGRRSLVTERPLNPDGFSVISESGEVAGVITEVIRNPYQWLVKVDQGNKSEMLIPFHEDLIITIDEAGRRIIMKIPEGLDGIN